jgi:hypothetical protein
MKDHVDLLEEWQHKLPDEARALIPADKLVQVMKISPERGEKRKDVVVKSSKAGKKKQKKFKFADELPEELGDVAKEWGKCVLEGGTECIGSIETVCSLKQVSTIILCTLCFFNSFHFIVC